MNSVAGRQFLNCPLALDRFHGDFRLECCGVLLPLSLHVSSIRQRFSTLGPCPVFGVQLSPRKDVSWKVRGRIAARISQATVDSRGADPTSQLTEDLRG